MHIVENKLLIIVAFLLSSRLTVEAQGTVSGVLGLEERTGADRGDRFP